MSSKKSVPATSEELEMIRKLFEPETAFHAPGIGAVNGKDRDEIKALREMCLELEK